MRATRGALPCLSGGTNRMEQPPIAWRSNLRPSSVNRERPAPNDFWAMSPLCQFVTFHCRSSSHLSDRVLIQFTASEWPLKVSTCSIVPSGHSASTDHFSPSHSTTQKTGFTIVNPTAGRPANNHYGALQQICGWSGRCSISKEATDIERGHYRKKPPHKSRRIIYEV